MTKNRISKVTTRAGDGGQTKLATGRTIQKSGQYVKTIGSVDELNSHIGLALAQLPAQDTSLVNLMVTLKAVQQDLFDIGAVLAMEGEYDAPKYTILEAATEQMNASLPALTEFVLPGGNITTSQLHVCRTVCRRAEAEMWMLLEDWNEPPMAAHDCARYLNRLSDLLFVAARTANDATEEQWQGPTTTGS